MIGIIFNTRESRRVYGYLKGCGVDTEQVEIVNKNNYSKCKVIIRFGGKGVRSNHCYVKQGFPVPEVQVFDPSTAFKEPFNHHWICLGIEKAKHIAKHGVPNEYKIDIRLRQSIEEIEKFLEGAKKTISAFDIESDPDTGCITTFGIAYRGTNGAPLSASIPLVEQRNGKPISIWSPMNEEKVWSLIADYLSCNSEKVMQNYIFDTMMMSRQGIETGGTIHDTMILQHLIEPEFKYYKALKLEDLGRQHLYIEPWKGVKSFVSTESLWKYNARDAAYTLFIYEKQREIIDAEKDKRKLYEDVLARLPLEVLRMCERGWAIDNKFLDKATRSLESQTEGFRTHLAAIADDLIPPKVNYKYRKGAPKDGIVYYVGLGKPTKEKYKLNSKGAQVLQDVAYADYAEIDGEELKGLKKLSEAPSPVFEKIVEERVFNPASPLQVKEVFQGLGIPLPTKTDSKGITKERTDTLSLMRLLDKFPDCEFAKYMLKFRKTEKILTTYCRFTPDPDGKARFSITIPGTVSSRFSSKMTPWKTGFNSQNIPKKIKVDGKTKNFRSVSIPHEKDYVILNMDLKQADPHMVAWLSNCESMLKILMDPKGDLHSNTASMIYGYDITSKVGFDKDTDLERKLGKIANNGLNYGMKPKTFRNHARKQGMVLSMAEAQAAYDGYHNAYPEVQGVWYAEVEDAIRRGIPIRTPFGRTRDFYGHKNDDYAMHKLMCEALAYVPPTQVSDAVNWGNMYFLDACRKEGVRIDWLQQCHDSNKWQVHKDDLDYACQLMIQSYDKVVFEIKGRECKFAIDIEYGDNWGELTEWRKK